jgi:hypothetical protein
MKSKMVRGILAMLVVPLPVCAALGGDASSVQADQAKMQGTLRSTSADAYTVHEIQTAAGVAVKEYASSAGKVFAVTWQGPVHPDLRQLLGDYFDQYVQALQEQRAQRHGHGPVLIQQAGLVVQITGHVRSFMGRAYVAQMVPAGVKAEELR